MKLSERIPLSLFSIIVALITMSSTSTIHSRSTESHDHRTPDVSMKTTKPSHLVKRRVTPGLFIAPWVLNANFGFVWYLSQNPSSRPITSYGIDNAHAAILQQKALIAISDAIQVYAQEHPEVAEKVILDIREMALLEQEKSLPKDEQAREKRAQSDVWRFFRDHPDLQNLATMKFVDETENMDLDSDPADSDDDDDQPDEAPPRDWAHIFSAPVINDDGSIA